MRHFFFQTRGVIPTANLSIIYIFLAKTSREITFVSKFVSGNDRNATNRTNDHQKDNEPTRRSAREFLKVRMKELHIEFQICQSGEEKNDDTVDL
mmetsp:Transcript_65108/g.74827  ORF Transcript_65108/g.74827 Transcript_65108/m.74827 type:complete len:95 (-) Transcript_65108:64-348(-)